MRAPQAVKKQPDRAQARQYHITYAALYAGELTHASIKADARAWAEQRDDQLVEIQTAREDHEEPADPERSEHFHVFVHFAKKLSMRNRRTTKVFDLLGRDGRTLHPEVQAVGPTAGDRQRVLAYGRKHGDFEHDLAQELPDPDEVEPERSWGEKLNEASNARAGMHMLMVEHPYIYYSMGARVEAMLQARLGDTSAKEYELKDFSRSPLQLGDGPIVLHGISGAGKTEFAVAHFNHPFIVRRRDDLKRIGMLTDGIIFDDMTFSAWDPEEVIFLLSWTKMRSLGARYSDAIIPARTPLIFTTNMGMAGPYDTIFPRGRNAQQAVAIERRHTCIAVNASLY